MAANKTIETKASVIKYLATIKEESRRKDFSAVIEIISKKTGLEPKMWGTAIVGFGTYHYIYDSGREGDAPLVGVASRANSITFYLGDFDDKETLLSKFGKYTMGKGCIHIKKLSDIDTGILTKMVMNAVARRKKTNLC